VNGDSVALDQILAPLDAVGIFFIQLTQDFSDSLQIVSIPQCCLYPRATASDAGLWGQGQIGAALLSPGN